MTEPSQVTCVVKMKNTAEKMICCTLSLDQSTNPAPSGISNPIAGMKRLLNNLSLIIPPQGLKLFVQSFIFPSCYILTGDKRFTNLSSRNHEPFPHIPFPQQSTEVGTHSFDICSQLFKWQEWRFFCFTNSTSGEIFPAKLYPDKRVTFR